MYLYGSPLGEIRDQFGLRQVTPPLPAGKLVVLVLVEETGPSQDSLR